ncbi:MAG: (Fe-S)-binding protein [Deltaproteobacteria bacterium]|nr:(Fe-S)-binding protein [Deltaproteobacteria bacterium]
MSDAATSQAEGLRRLDDHEQPLEHCTYCPKMCRLACPMAEATGRESVTPWALMGLANHVRKGHVGLDAEIARSFYDCTGCLRCQPYCLHGNDVPTTLWAAREIAVGQGAVPAEVAAAKACFDANGSMFEPGDRAAAAAAVAEAVPGQAIDAKAPDVLFLACATAANPRRAADAARAATGALGKVALPDPALRCCGAPLRDLGFVAEFKAVARANQALLAGHERIVCDASICARTLEKEYPKVGADLGVPVVDLVTSLDGALTGDKLKGIKKRTEKAVYHDPCHLGRHAGVYDAPRRLASALFEKPLGEFPWSRERGSCCGGGGGFPFVDRRSARMMASAIADEAREAGYELIVTGSAECAAMLSEAQPSFPVRTIACLVGQMLR